MRNLITGGASLLSRALRPMLEKLKGTGEMCPFDHRRHVSASAAGERRNGLLSKMEKETGASPMLEKEN